MSGAKNMTSAMNHHVAKARRAHRRPERQACRSAEPNVPKRPVAPMAAGRMRMARLARTFPGALK